MGRGQFRNITPSHFLPLVFMLHLRFVGVESRPPHPQPFSPLNECEHDSHSSKREKGARLEKMVWICHRSRISPNSRCSSVAVFENNLLVSTRSAGFSPHQLISYEPSAHYLFAGCQLVGVSLASVQAWSVSAPVGFGE
jgi:hypothetical protein